MIPSTDSLLIKLGSIAVHADEFLSPHGLAEDATAIRGLLADPEVAHWITAVQRDMPALLPVKRNA